MAHLTNNELTELTDVVFPYGQGGKNAVQAPHIYQKQFRNRRIPNIYTIVRIIQHLFTQNRGVQRPRLVLQIWRKIF
jgi:hypothetical protein